MKYLSYVCGVWRIVTQSVSQIYSFYSRDIGKQSA